MIIRILIQILILIQTLLLQLLEHYHGVLPMIFINVWLKFIHSLHFIQLILFILHLLLLHYHQYYLDVILFYYFILLSLLLSFIPHRLHLLQQNEQIIRSYLHQNLHLSYFHYHYHWLFLQHVYYDDGIRLHVFHFLSLLLQHDEQQSKISFILYLDGRQLNLLLHHQLLLHLQIMILLPIHFLQILMMSVHHLLNHLLRHFQILHCFPHLLLGLNIHLFL